MLHLLGSKSQGLLLLGEVEVLGHLIDERGGFVVCETENEEGVNPIVE